MRLTSLLILFGALAAVAAAQAPAAKAGSSTKPYVTPKTPWGDPDLQGLWPATDMINVPVQRRAELGTRDKLTEEEFKQQQATARTKRRNGMQNSL